MSLIMLQHDGIAHLNSSWEGSMASKSICGLLHVSCANSLMETLSFLEKMSLINYLSYRNRWGRFLPIFMKGS